MPASNIDNKKGPCFGAFLNEFFYTYKLYPKLT